MYGGHEPKFGKKSCYFDSISLIASLKSWPYMHWTVLKQRLAYLLSTKQHTEWELEANTLVFGLIYCIDGVRDSKQ